MRSTNNGHATTAIYKSGLRTQISGRYHSDNLGLFGFKNHLEMAGLLVTFPVGNEVLKREYGFAYTTLEEAQAPYYLTESQFLQDISNCDLQITYDLRGKSEGYVGESTAVETALALILEKPTVLLRPIAYYSEHVSSFLMDFLHSYRESMHIVPLDSMPASHVHFIIQEIVAEPRGQVICKSDRLRVEEEILGLMTKYHRSWITKISAETENAEAA